MNLADIVCIVEHDKYHVFEDYIVSLGLNLKVRLYPCSINKGEKVMVVQRLHDLNYEDASYIGFLNTEQLTDNYWIEYYKSHILKSKYTIHLFDYSMANVKHLERILGCSSTYLQYGYRNEEVDKLTYLINTTEKIYDLA
jgi:hypothetical protein